MLLSGFFGGIGFNINFNHAEFVGIKFPTAQLYVSPLRDYIMNMIIRKEKPSDVELIDKMQIM